VRAIELATKQSFTTEEARAVATQLEIDFGALGCDLEQFRMGLDVELEQGRGTRRLTSAGTIRSSRGRSRLPT